MVLFLFSALKHPLISFSEQCSLQENNLELYVLFEKTLLIIVIFFLTVLVYFQIDLRRQVLFLIAFVYQEYHQY